MVNKTIINVKSIQSKNSQKILHPSAVVLSLLIFWLNVSIELFLTIND